GVGGILGIQYQVVKVNERVEEVALRAEAIDERLDAFRSDAADVAHVSQLHALREEVQGEIAEVRASMSTLSALEAEAATLAAQIDALREQLSGFLSASEFDTRLAQRER